MNTPSFRRFVNNKQTWLPNAFDVGHSLKFLLAVHPDAKIEPLEMINGVLGLVSFDFP